MSEEKSSLSGVFYIDGSCRPHNPGYIGWGVHGYLYQESAEKPVEVDGFTLTTHGYLANGGEWHQNAKPVVPTKYVDGFGSHKGLLTNNVAEIQALLNLLKFIEDKKFAVVRIYTDSEYLKTCINEFCRRWEKTNWTKQDGSPVSNREWIEPSYNLFKSMKASGTVLELNWIRSHNGHIGNERADVLAGIGMNHSQACRYLSSFEESEAKGYWKHEVERNPYIAFRRLYFNSVVEHHRPGVYHIAESTDTDFIIGKPSASSGYSVLYLKEPDEVIEQVKLKQFENSRGLNVILLMKLDALYSKHIYPWVQKYGDMCLVGQKNTHSMALVNKNSVTVEMNPTGLSLRALDYFGMLEQMLICFQNSKITGEPIMIGGIKPTIHDITSRFYQDKPDKKNPTKKELLPEFVNGYKNLTIEIEESIGDKQVKIKIPYALGYDCLPRNNLKYLETANPIVSLLTWPEGNILRYATIIESDFGVGIWSNFFANQVLLPLGK